MKEPSGRGDQSLIEHHQTAEMAKSREHAFDDPPAAIPQHPVVFMRRPLVVTRCRDNRVNAAPRPGVSAAGCFHSRDLQSGGQAAGGDVASRYVPNGGPRAIDQTHPLMHDCQRDLV
jgi:hypothetical protein